MHLMEHLESCHVSASSFLWKLDGILEVVRFVDAVHYIFVDGKISTYLAVSARN